MTVADRGVSVQVSALTVRSKREMYGMTVTRPRSSFRKPYTFADRDTSTAPPDPLPPFLCVRLVSGPVSWWCAGFDGAVEFRSHKDPAFDLVRREADIGLQVTHAHHQLEHSTWICIPVFSSDPSR